MADRIQLRRDTAANWTAYNPILLEGEPGIEIDTDQWKLGDGVHTWSQLAYRGGECVQQRGQSTTVAMSQKAVTDELNLIGVFDISAHNLTDGQPTKYADLTAALGTNGANVPEQYRVPGMTIRYVQSSDNKYVQYRYMGTSTANDDFANVANWQGVDEEPTAGSDNLVKSGGVKQDINEVKVKTGIETSDTYTNFSGIIWDGTSFIASTDIFNSVIIPLDTNITYKADVYCRTFATLPVIGQTAAKIRTINANTSFTPTAAEQYAIFVVSSELSQTSVTIQYSTENSIKNQLENKISAVSENVSNDDTRIDNLELLEGSQNTITFEKLSNLIWDGSTFVASTDHYNSVILPLEEGRQYTANRLCSIFSVKPVLNLQASRIRKIVENQTFIAKAGEKYGVFLIDLSLEQNSVTVSLSEGGLKKNLSELSKEVGHNNITNIYDSSDYSGMIWDGTSIVASTERFNSVIVKLSSNETYTFDVRARIFSTMPVIGAQMSPITTYEANTSHTPSTGENYAMLTVGEGIGTTVTENIKSTKLFEQVDELEAEIKDVGHKTVTKIFGSESYSGMIWDGTAIVPSTSRFNSVIIKLSHDDTYKFSSFVRVFETMPAIGASIPLVTTYNANVEYSPSGNENYGMIMLDVQVSATATVIQYANGLFKRVNVLEDKVLYSDLKVVCFGDSITEFRDSHDKGYCAYMHDISNATVVRAGIGGSRWSRRGTPTLNPTNIQEAYAALDVVSLVSAWCDNDWSYVDAAEAWLLSNVGTNHADIIQSLKSTPISGVDVVTIMCGGNDYVSNIPLGGLDSSNIETIQGAINAAMDKLYSTKQSIKIYLFSNIVKCIDNEIDSEHFSDNWENTNGDTLIDINAGIKDCALKYHVPYGDTYFSMGWNLNNWPVYFTHEATHDVDGSHPWTGFKYLAEKMWSFMVGNKIW